MRILLLLLCSLLMAALARADSVIQLSPYVVVAPRLAMPDLNIESDTVRRAKPIDLAEVLSSALPEMAMARRGPIAGDLILRGLSRDNILISVDGTKTFCACPNRMDPPAFHVSSQQIESISIRKGPFHVEEGGTTGGAVLVGTNTTDMGDANRSAAYLFAGAFNYLAGGIKSASLISSDNLSLGGGLFYQQGDVYKDGKGTSFTQLPGTNFRESYQEGRSFQLASADIKGAWNTPSGSTLSLVYGYQDAVDVLYPGLRMDALVDTMNRLTVGYEIPMESAWAESVQLSLAMSNVDHDMQDRFRMSSQMNPDFAERGYMMRTKSETGYLGLNVKFELQTTGAALRYGATASRRTWDANNIIMMLQNDMLPDVEADSFGIWAVHERRHGDWSWETGFRGEFSTTKANESIDFIQDILGTETNRVEDFLPSAYVMIQRTMDEGWNLYAGLGYGTRVPDPQERYMNLNRPGNNPDWIGNPDLEPVSNTEIQVGLNRVRARYSFGLSMFHAWLSDYTYLSSYVSSGSKATTYTGIDARLYGCSGMFSWQVMDRVVLEGGLAWQEGVKSSRPPQSTNDVLGEVPPLKARMALAWEPDDWYLRIEAQYQDSLDRVDPDLQEVPMEDWVTWNLSIGWTPLDGLTLSAGLDNIFDQHYALANAYVRDPFRSGAIVTEPGRFLYGRVSLEW